MHAILQVIKDWHLLIVVLLIGVVEILFAVPLLALALTNGDIVLQPSLSMPSSLNVSIMIMLMIKI